MEIDLDRVRAGFSQQRIQDGLQQAPPNDQARAVARSGQSSAIDRAARWVRRLLLISGSTSASVNAAEEQRCSRFAEVVKPHDSQGFLSLSDVTLTLTCSSKGCQKRRYCPGSCDPDHTQHVRVMVELLCVA
jgi:hypothetical protein